MHRASFHSPSFRKQIDDLWSYRELLKELSITWLKLRHTGSALGLLWTLISPAVFIATYWIVFTYIVRIDLPDYATFLIPGFLAWNFTWTAIQGASGAVQESSYLISKVAFPSEILVLSGVFVPFFDFLIALGLYLLIALVVGVSVTPVALLLPAVIVIHLLFTLGVGFLVACGSVFYRDIPKLVSLLSVLLFFLTPVFYPLSIVPERLSIIAELNPFTALMSLYHSVLYFGQIPSWSLWVGFMVFSGLLGGLGLRVFGRVKSKFAELS